jgi:hypothetical protein
VWRVSLFHAWQKYPRYLLISLLIYFTIEVLIHIRLFMYKKLLSLFHVLSTDIQIKLTNSMKQRFFLTQLFRKSPSFYGIWRYITTSTRACSQVNRVHKFPLYIIIFPFVPSLLSGLFPSVFRPKFCIYFSCLPCMLHDPPFSLPLTWSPK